MVGRLRRPALPHPGELRLPVGTRRRGQGGGRTGADPPGDHRPRPDRRRARSARAGTRRADGDRRRRGQDRRWRPHLPVPRPGHPAWAVGGRDDRRGARAGRARGHPAPVRRVSRLAPARRAAGRAGRPGRLGRAPQRAGHRAGEPAGGSVRDRPRASRASRSPTPIRSSRSASPTRSSRGTHRRPPACSRRSRTSPAPSSCPGGPASWSVPGHPMAKAVQRSRGNRRVKAVGRPARRPTIEATSGERARSIRSRATGTADRTSRSMRRTSCR